MVYRYLPCILISYQSSKVKATHLKGKARLSTHSCPPINLIQGTNFNMLEIQVENPSTIKDNTTINNEVFYHITCWGAVVTELSNSDIQQLIAMYIILNMPYPLIIKIV